MNPVARLAGNGRVTRELRTNQAPRPLRIHRLNHVPNRFLEVHPVAPEAVIHQLPLRVVRWVQKNVGKSRAVRSRMPCRVLVLMASLALGHHWPEIGFAQMDLLRRAVQNMHPRVPQLRGHARLVAIRAAGVAMRRGMDRVHARRHLVAIRAGRPVTHGVVQVDSICPTQTHQRHRHRTDRQPEFHERNFVPFQLRTSASDA